MEDDCWARIFNLFKEYHLQCVKSMHEDSDSADCPFNEVEIAKSVGELTTSQSLEGRDFLILICLMRGDCVCIEEKYLQSAFPKKSSCRRAVCSKTRQFSSRKAACSHDL